MGKLPTRAACYGVKPAALAARSRRLTKRARYALGALSALWDENFQPVAFDAELLIEGIEALEREVDEGLAYLREPMEGAGSVCPTLAKGSGLSLHVIRASAPRPSL